MVCFIRQHQIGDNGLILLKDFPDSPCLFLRRDLLHIGHDLFHKGAGFAALQLLPDGGGVDVLKIVQFLLGKKAVLFNELCDPALDLGPGQFQHLRTALTDNEQIFARSPAVLTGQPLRRTFFPPMGLHVADNTALAVQITVPRLEGLVNIVLGQRPQQLMELGIGFVYDLPMQPVTKFRHIRKEPNQFHIARMEDRTAHSGVALNDGVLPVGVAAGVAVSRVLGDGGDHYRLIFVILLPDSRRWRFCFMVDRTQRINAALIGCSVHR